MFFLKRENIKAYYRQHKDLITFGLTVIIIHSIWKFGSEASDDHLTIHFYGLNFSSFFSVVNEWWSIIIHKTSQIFYGDQINISGCNIWYPDSQTGILIIWGCSGVKEFIMGFFVIATARGAWFSKLWFIPLSMFTLLLANYIRLMIITLAMHQHPEWFDFLHSILGRIIIYGTLFSVWYIWIEKIQSKKIN